MKPKWLSFIIFALFLLLVVIQGVQAGETYRYVTQWGKYGSGNGEFSTPADLAIDSSGNVYVADRDNGKIQKFDDEGILIKTWNSGYEPVGIAVDSSGNVYVGDSYNGKIQKFTSDGTTIGDWDSGGLTSIAVDSLGFVYVTDRYQSKIRKFTSDGTLIKEWGSEGSGDGQFKDFAGIAVDSAGFVYVTEWNRNIRIQKFDSDGNFVTKWGSRGNGDGQFFYAWGIAVDPAGFVYVADISDKEFDPSSIFFHSRIQKFDSQGTFISKWGSHGSGDGQFIIPMGVAVASPGFVYVSEQGNHRIQKFSPVYLHIIPTGDQCVGDKFTVNATTSLNAGEEVLVQVYSATTGRPAQKSPSGEFSGASGTVRVEPRGDGTNYTSFDIDASTFKPDRYLINETSLSVPNLNDTSNFSVTSCSPPISMITTTPTIPAPPITTVGLDPCIIISGIVCAVGLFAARAGWMRK
jgi:hypothetical protein